MSEHWAVKWVGCEYGNVGRGPKFFDCWGLVYSVYKKDFHIIIPSYDTEYNSSENGKQIQEVIEAECGKGWYLQDQAKEGDVIIFRILSRRMHCGIALDSHRFLHVLFGCNGVVESTRDFTWNRRVEGIYRHELLL